MSDNMHGFKAYEPGLICRGHKYEENTVYKKSGHGICVPGVTHYCVNPFDVLDYYPLVQDVFYTLRNGEIVEAEG